MIDVRDLTVRFGPATVVDGVTFHVPAGGSLALWGENGAGKTTAIRAMLGLVPFDGTVRVAGHDVRTHGRAVRAAVGYVPQQLSFYDDMSSLAFLHFIAGLRRAPRGQAEALLERVQLGAHAGKAVGALSGGMKQRLALAAALLADPPVLVLDEPTASLDAAARADFTHLLIGLRSSGKTLIVTSHRLAEVSALAEHVVVLEQGRMRLDCAAADLEAALYPDTTLRIVVAAADLAPAQAVLVGGGFDVHPNGRGLRVRVAPGRRAAPVAALVAAGITVEDLDVEDGAWTAT